MSFLLSSSERAYVYAMNQKRALREELALGIEIILEEVHPSNLGALPPSPKRLAIMAYNRGLICHSAAVLR